MIIVEGLDNTGKTTLIQNIMSIFPMLKQGKMDKAPEASENDYRNYVWNILSKTPRATQFMLFDRFLFSEVVYGPILRGKIRMTDPEIVAAFRLLKDHKPLIIYCQRTEAEIRETFAEREQLSGVEENLPHLLDAYKLWMRSWNHITYDYGRGPKELAMIITAVGYHLRKTLGFDFLDNQELVRRYDEEEDFE